MCHNGIFPGLKGFFKLADGNTTAKLIGNVEVIAIRASVHFQSRLIRLPNGTFQSTDLFDLLTMRHRHRADLFTDGRPGLAIIVSMKQLLSVAVHHIDRSVQEGSSQHQNLANIKVRILFKLITQTAVPVIKIIEYLLCAIIDCRKADPIQELHD